MNARSHIKDQQELIALLFAVRGLIRDELSRGGGKSPHMWLKLETLRFIKEHDGPSLHDVAHFLHVSMPSASAFVARLIRQGLVSKEQGKDRRAMQLRVTKAGEQELAKAKTSAARALRGVFGRLQEQDAAQLAVILHKLLNT